MSDNANFVQAQSFSLYGSGASQGATSVTLTSMKQIDGTTNITMTNFGTIGFMTLEPNQSTQEEQISFTGITQNASGTATLTGVSTVLFISPYTKTSGLAKSHPGGAKAIISNTAGFYDELTSKDNDETINGLYTFVQFPQKSGTTTPTVAAELASKAYVDLVAGGVAVTNQLLVSGTAGEALTAGYIVYKKASDGKWYISKANDTTTFQQLELGIAQSSVSSGASVNVLIRGLDSNQSGLSAGTSYYVTDAGGLPSSTAGTNTVFVGYGQAATTLLVDFRSIDMPYHGEKNALAGTSGTPGSLNKYVTAADVSSVAVAGKIVRATSTQSLPALSGFPLFSISIPGLFISGQTKGDLIYKVNGNGWTRLPIGTQSQFLSSGVANIPVWTRGNKSSLGKSIDGTAGTITNGSTYFTSPFSLAAANTTENAGFIVPYAGTIRNLFIRTSAASNNGTNTVFVRKNGSNTTLTVVVTASNSTTFSDTTHNFTVVAGDLITVSYAATVGNSQEPVSMSMELDG